MESTTSTSCLAGVCRVYKLSSSHKSWQISWDPWMHMWLSIYHFSSLNGYDGPEICQKYLSIVKSKPDLFPFWETYSAKTSRLRAQISHQSVVVFVFHKQTHSPSFFSGIKIICLGSSWLVQYDRYYDWKCILILSSSVSISVDRSACT